MRSLHACTAIFALIISLAGMSKTVGAQSSLYEAGVAQAEFTPRQGGIAPSEWTGLVATTSSGPATYKNDALSKSSEVEISFAKAEWLALGAETNLEDRRGLDGRSDTAKLSDVLIHGSAEILPNKDLGVDASFYLGYESSGVGGQYGKQLTFGPTLTKEYGSFTATGNRFAVRSIDSTGVEIDGGEIVLDRAPDHWNVSYYGQLYYGFNDNVGLALEASGEVTDVTANIAGKTANEHQIGPVLYVNVDLGRNYWAGGVLDDTTELELSFSTLFGLTEESSDVALRWDASIDY